MSNEAEIEKLENKIEEIKKENQSYEKMKERNNERIDQISVLLTQKQEKIVGLTLVRDDKKLSTNTEQDTMLLWNTGHQ